MSGIYIASKSKHGAKWKAFREDGEPIISTWIDEYEDGATSDWTDLWERCLREASTARAFIMYVEPGEEHKGSLIELGAALLAGVPVFWVGPTIGSVWRSARVTMCESIGDALARCLGEMTASVEAPRPRTMDPGYWDDAAKNLQLTRAKFEAWLGANGWVRATSPRAKAASEWRNEAMHHTVFLHDDPSLLLAALAGITRDKSELGRILDEMGRMPTETSAG